MKLGFINFWLAELLILSFFIVKFTLLFRDTLDDRILTPFFILLAMHLYSIRQWEIRTQEINNEI